MNIRAALQGDYDQVCQLLKSENLPTEDIPSSMYGYLVVETEGRIIASIALEEYGNTALLRSMVVANQHRDKGIASELVNRVMLLASDKGIKQVYLITTTAEDYFIKKKFNRIRREEVEGDVIQSQEFNGLCPASSAIMLRLV